VATGWEWERLPAGGPDLTEEVENLDQRVSDLEDAPGGGGGPPHAARLALAFENGGTIAQWQLYPLGGTTYATYNPWGGSTAVGAVEFPLLWAPSAGTYTIHALYDVDRDLLFTIRIRAVDGTWTTLRTETLDLLESEASFTVALGAGEALGLHVAPVGNSTVSINYIELFT